MSGWVVFGSRSPLASAQPFAYAVLRLSCILWVLCGFSFSHPSSRATETPSLRYADAYRNEMVAFVNCAHEGKPSPVGVPDGRAAYLIGKAAKASMESGMVRRDVMSLVRGSSTPTRYVSYGPQKP